MNYFHMGNEQYSIKNYKEAIYLYKQAALDKGNENVHASALYNAAVCFIKLKDYNNAIIFLKSAISKKEDSKYYFNLAYCYNLLGNYKKALIYFNTSWSLNNEDDDCKNAINSIIQKYKKI